MTEAIVHALKSRRAVIIFDNCEHVVEPAARLIDAILRSCPNLRIIATTRQGLGIAGESVHRVASLAVPETTGHLSAEEAMRHGAIALFVERAIAATESFASPTRTRRSSRGCATGSTASLSRSSSPRRVSRR